MVFVCENNHYMEYTPIADVIAVKRPAADRAAAYGLAPDRGGRQRRRRRARRARPRRLPGARRRRPVAGRGRDLPARRALRGRPGGLPQRRGGGAVEGARPADPATRRGSSRGRGARGGGRGDRRAGGRRDRPDRRRGARRTRRPTRRRRGRTCGATGARRGATDLPRHGASPPRWRRRWRATSGWCCSARTSRRAGCSRRRSGLRGPVRDDAGAQHPDLRDGDRRGGDGRGDGRAAAGRGDHVLGLLRRLLGPGRRRDRQGPLHDRRAVRAAAGDPRGQRRRHRVRRPAQPVGRELGAVRARPQDRLARRRPPTPSG